MRRLWTAVILASGVAACGGSATSGVAQLPAGPYATLGALEEDVDAQRAAGIPDSDGDSLPDSVEGRLGTSPDDRDSDRDGLSDNFELFGTGFDPGGPLPDGDRDGILAPLDADDDSDHVNDGETVDSDGDGIPNYLEYYGYTYDFLTGRFLPWNGDPAVKPYFTDPLQASTDQDAYSDATEASGALLDPSVEDPGADPLVPAYPDIMVELAAYSVTLNEEIQLTQGESIEKGRSWTRQTERSYAHTDERSWQLGGEVSLGSDTGVKVSANYGETHSDTNTTSWSVAVGESVTTSESWSRARSFNPTDAARIKLFLKARNRGTAPISNLVPTLTLRVGGLNVATFEPGSPQVQMLVPGGIYPSEAGVYWTVSTTGAGAPLSLTMTELRALERGAPVSITVTQIRGDAMRLTPDATWERIGDVNEHVARCDAVCANLRIDLGDGDLVHHLVYADDSPSAPRMRLGDALGRIGVDADGTLHYVDRKGMPRARPLGEFTFAFDDETLRANGWTVAGDDGGETSPPDGYELEQTVLLPATTLVVRAPRDPQAAPGPVIHFAYLDPESGEIQVCVTDYQGVSDVEVRNESGSPVLTLAEDVPGAGFYSAFVSEGQEGLLSIVATNLAGDEAQADLGRLFVEAGPQPPVINSLSLDSTNRLLYANVSSGNPGDPVSEILWVRAYHRGLPGGYTAMERTIYFFEDPDGYSVALPIGFTGKDVEVIAFVTDGVYARRTVTSEEVIDPHRIGSATLDAETEWPNPAIRWINGDPYRWHIAILDVDAGTYARRDPVYKSADPYAWNDANNPGPPVDLWVRVDGPEATASGHVHFNALHTKLGQEDYDSLTKDQIVNAQPSSRSSLLLKGTDATGLATGDVLAILTTDGRYGKIQVTGISEGNGALSTYKTYHVTVRYVVYK